MKIKLYLIILLQICFCKFSIGQILCIYCYDQNDSISNNVNNLLLNGGFENSTCAPYPGDKFCPNSSGYSCDILNWVCTGGGINTYAGIFDSSYSIISEGSKAAYLGNQFCKACSPTTNDTSCINNLLCEVTGIPVGYPVNTSNYGGSMGVSLEQTVTGLVVGNTYVLEFWAGGENYPGHYINKGIFAVNIGFGNTFLRCNPTKQFTQAIGRRYIIEFNATFSSHTIKFTNWGHIRNNCTELVLDDVRLYTLAELDPSVPSCFIGVNSPSFENLENLVSPNPFTNELNVKSYSNYRLEIIIYDISNRIILQQEFTNYTSLNTELLSKGIYIYEIRNETGFFKKGKIVKD